MRTVKEAASHPVIIGAALSVAAGILVFLAAMTFTNPSYAFYAGFAVALCGVLLTPKVLALGK